MSKVLQKKDLKTLGLSSLGGTLEFYDFIIFVFFAEFISKAFFPKDLSPFWQMFNTYGVFAAGYLARPLGGMIMAHFGDKIGRKNMFMLSIVLMVLPTFALGFIPGFESIGYSCIVLLILVRICQGISIGGELPGAWVFIHEHAPKNQRRTYLGALTASVVSGILLGSIVFLIMNKLYTREELFDWAWRVPFFLGGIFGLISIYLRRFLSETPVFEKMKKDKILVAFPLKEVFARAKMGVFLSMLITWVLTACIVVMILLVPSFSAKILNLTPINQTYFQMSGIISIAFGCFVAGFAADKFGVVRSCAFFALGFLLFSALFFNSLYTSEPIFKNVWIFYILACFFGGVMNFCPVMMCELFDAKIKFSGLSFAYNIAYAIAGGFTPQLALFLHANAVQNLENFARFSLGFYIFALAFVAFLCAVLFAINKNLKKS